MSPQDLSEAVISTGAVQSHRTAQWRDPRISPLTLLVLLLHAVADPKVRGLPPIFSSTYRKYGGRAKVRKGIAGNDDATSSEPVRAMKIMIWATELACYDSCDHQMPDLSGLYGSPKVLFWLTFLSLYGTVEGVIRLVRHLPPLYRRIANNWRSNAHDTDFYYSYRESGYIIMPGGLDFVSSRRERVVALKRIEEVPYSYRWTGEGTISEELFPETFKLEDVQRAPGQVSVRRSIKFDTALDKGGETEYTILLRCKRTGEKAPEPFLSTRSHHRVDELLLRVVFPANLLPDQVVYVRRNKDGIETHRESIKERDRLTGEFRKLIKYAEPHVAHVIEWTATP